MGWTDAVGKRVSRFIGRKSSRSNLMSEEVGVAGSDEKAEGLKGQSTMKRVRSTLDPDEEFEGPDTSSLTAFLLSLLSIPRTQSEDETSSASTSEYSDEENALPDEDGEVNQYTQDFPEFNEDEWTARGGEILETTEGLLASLWDKRRWLWGRSNGRANLPEARGEDVPSTGREEGSLQDEISTHFWRKRKGHEGFLPTENVEMSVMDNIQTGEAERQEKDAKEGEKSSDRPNPGMISLSPRKLPEMSDESFLLSESNRSVICDSLPAIANGRDWVLLYSTIRHGISLLTLYRRCALLPGPCLVVVGDFKGAIFGGYSSGPLSAMNKKKYLGSSDSFVFKVGEGQVDLYKATGINRYFVLCLNEALAFGGGEHFALRLEEDLLHGSSGTCETFGSPCLAHTEDFAIKQVEVWGFSHISRYAPKQAAWHEPEKTPSFHTW